MRIRRIDYTDWGEETMLDEVVVEDVGMVHLERTSKQSGYIGVYSGKDHLGIHLEVRQDGALNIWVESAPESPQRENK